VSRLVKDQETLDNQLALTLSQFLGSFTSVLGTVALVFYTFPYLGIIFAPMTLIYYVVSVYYRRSSVETKRLDSLMRSKLYASFSGGSASPRPPPAPDSRTPRNADRTGHYPSI
jgi:ABC-type multidrug transport system fused ATPase/permease subunit